MPKFVWPLAIVAAFVLGGAAVLFAEWSQYRQTASLEQLMEATVTPASNAVFDAAVWINGEPVNLPKTAADWEIVEHGAITLAEVSNLLLMPGRAKDWGDWRRYAHDLNAAARAAERAALNKNVDEVLQAGDQIYQACTNCHRKYLLPEGQ
jgi:hypothetical protein